MTDNESDSSKKPQENIPPSQANDNSLEKTNNASQKRADSSQLETSAGKTSTNAKAESATNSPQESKAAKASKPTTSQTEAVDGKEKKVKPGTAAPSPRAGKPKRSFPFVAVLALMVGVGAVAASYFNYTRWELSDAQAKALTSKNTLLQNRLDTLQQKIGGLESQDEDFKLKDQQLGADLSLQGDSVKQLSHQLQSLSAEQGRDPLLWRVAEVEYLLSVANNRVQLERDSDTALVALQDADKRLETIGDPALIPIRKTIAGEVNALQSVEKPDITGMALRLSSLVDGIDKLPLVSRERIKPEEEKDSSQLVNSFSQFWANVVKDLKGVVTIRRSEEPIEPLLPPDEQYYLSQNLSLKLEEARIALLNRDTQTFRQDITDTRQWVEQYFDKDSAAVSTVVDTLDNLQQTDLKPQLPDISSSLRQLRHWMALQQHSLQQNSIKSPPPGGNPGDSKG